MRDGHRWVIGVLVAVALAVLVLIAPGEEGALAQGGIIYYVDADAEGANNGTSWTDAYTDLQLALAEAVEEDQIWVAEGTYKPTSGTDRSASFQMVNGVAIYGGFDPTVGVVDFGDRDWVLHETILSGDLNGDDGEDFENNGENSYHVFYHPSELALDGTAILDGFTITGGNANHLFFDISGGGMLNDGASPMLTNCTFSGNSAWDTGGGVHNHAASPTLANCTFEGNSANWGGGMYNTGSSPLLTNCTFEGNSAGGGMSNWESSPTLVNCTFFGNSTSVGGGIGNYYSSSPTLTNCILWGNSIPQIYDYDSSPDVTYSDVQGGYIGTGNIDADPLFVDSANGDFHLELGSPCIDVGNNAAPYLPEYDFEGEPRIMDGNNDGAAIVDMGVDEVYAGPTVVEVEIDVRPGSEQNPINLGSGGVVPVAILTTSEFDAGTVRAASVRFAGAAPRRWTMEDVDRDGDLDLLLNFRIRELDLDETSTEATLTGETFPHAGGVHIEGTDTVRIIP